MQNHLKQRHLNINLYNGIVCDDEEKVITFPLWNLFGQFVGYQQYRPGADKVRKNHPKLGRYFTYLPRNSNTAWGLERLNTLDRRLFLCEGIFKACRFHNYGLNALAVIGNNPKHLQEWIGLLSCHYEITCVCDDDDAGNALAKYGSTSIKCTVDKLTENEFKKFLTINKIMVE